MKVCYLEGFFFSLVIFFQRASTRFSSQVLRATQVSRIAPNFVFAARNSFQTAWQPLFSPSQRHFAGPASTGLRADGSREFLLADIGEGISEVEIMQWFIKAGDHLKEFDRVCEVQSDKATVEITSRFEGTVKELCYKAGQIAYVGKPLIILNGSSSSVAASADAEKKGATATNVSSVSSSQSQEGFTTRNGKVVCSPAVRRIARENNIDLTKIPGSGPQGRILKSDMFPAPTQIAVSAANAAPSQTSAPSATLTISVPHPVPVAAQAKGDKKEKASAPVDTRSYSYLVD
jgi:pyruvate/2-oxoglutarate dehydrogenase complex dihydrolipoamide acyltransferase (E2) component